MRYYPLTSIFRTTYGLIPAYRIAPFIANGEYQLKDPTFFMTDNTVSGVSQVKVNMFCNFNILTNSRNWAAVSDGYLSENIKMETLIGSKDRVEQPKHRVDIYKILRHTFIGGLLSSGLSLASARNRIESLNFYEIMSGHLTYEEYRSASSITLPFSILSKRHLYSITYIFLATLFRCRRLTYDKNIAKVRATISNNVWRDFIITSLLVLGVPVEVRYTAQKTFIYMLQDAFAAFNREAFIQNPDIPYRDFKLIRNTLGKNYVYVDENINHITENIDISFFKSIECSPYTITTATCPGIGFPELTGHVEHNSIIITEEEL